MAADIRQRAAEHAPDVDPERRERLATEKATLLIQARQASADVWCGLDGEGAGRGLLVETEREIDGDTVTIQDTNPAVRAEAALFRRQREIARELRLHPGYRGESGGD